MLILKNIPHNIIKLSLFFTFIQPGRNKMEKLTDGSPDYRDNHDLRRRFPKLHNLSVNDEILFICAPAKNFFAGRSGYEDLRLKYVPDGYEDTGCLLIPRKNRDVFRNFLLRTHDEFKFEIGTIQELKDCQRNYYWSLKGELLDIENWDKDMKNFEYFTDPNERYVLMPKNWLNEGKIYRIIQQRMSAVEKGIIICVR